MAAIYLQEMVYRVSQQERHRNVSHNFRLIIQIFKLLNRIEHGFLHNVWNLVDITSPLENVFVCHKDFKINLLQF